MKIMNLNKLPKEIIYKLITYLSYTNYWSLAILNKYYLSLNLFRFKIQPNIINILGDYSYLKSDILEYFREATLKDYLTDIYYSMYSIDLDYPNSLFKVNSILYTKQDFDYSSFRDIINHNIFTKNYKPKHSNIKLHIVYRIDRLSYLKIKRNHYFILALIY